MREVPKIRSKVLENSCSADWKDGGVMVACGGGGETTLANTTGSEDRDEEEDDKVGVVESITESLKKNN